MAPLSQVEAVPDAPPAVVADSTARRRDYGLTFATEFAVMLAGFLALKLAATYWGPAGFGEYVVLRRALAVMYLPVLCGMSLAVTRYVSLSRHEGPGRLASYAAAASLVTLATSGVFALVANSFRGTASSLIFGSESYREAISAVSIAVAGLAFHGVAYGIARGRFALVRANLLQAFNLAVVPLIVFLVPGLSLSGIVGGTGAVWLLVSGLAIAQELRSADSGRIQPAELRMGIRQLLSYGGPRVPGEFALGALFMIPVTLTAHRAGVTEAGFVGLGLSVLGMIGAMFAPLGSVLLPVVTSMLVREGRAAVRQHTVRLILLCLGLATAVVVVLELLLPWLIPLFLGEAFGPAIPILRIICLAGVFQVLYVILRNVLDAVEPWPLNAKNLAVALVTFLVLGWFSSDAPYLAWAFALSITLLGSLTAFDVARVLRRPAGGGEQA